jgi:hypothetical protein
VLVGENLERLLSAHGKKDLEALVTERATKRS